MKILYICTNFLQKSNSAAIRNLGLVSGLIECGCDVTVLTIDIPEGRRSDIYKTLSCEIIKYELSIEKLMSSTVSIRKKQDGSKLLRRLRHLMRSLLFFPDIYKEFTKRIDPSMFKEFDFVFSSSDMKTSHFAAKKIVDRNQSKKWIQIWGDPWHSDIGLEPVLKSIIKKNEKNLIERADNVIYVSEPTLIHCKQLFPRSSHKMTYIPRSYLRTVINNQTIGKKIKILYPGSLGPNRKLKPFVEWLGASGLDFELDVYGSIRDIEKEVFSAFDNVNMHDAVDYEDVLNLFEKVNLLLFLSNTENATQIPGKIFDYFGTNLPILCIMHSKDEPVSKFLLSHQNCKVITYRELEEGNIDIEEIVQFINCKFTPIEKYGPREVAKRILEIIK